MTVGELVTILQTWAHAGHAEDIVGAALYNGGYAIKDVSMFDKTGLTVLNLEPLSNERKGI